MSGKTHVSTDPLAAHLATDQGLIAARTLQRLALMPGQMRSPSLEPVPAGPRPILDWQPVDAGGETVFERARFFRCKPKTLHPNHPGVRRVVLFGESLAAGFPMAPAHTPAICLEGCLGADGDVEVIDLARPNMGPSEQLRVAEAAGQLNPDVYVFMTGNNWHYGLSVEPTADPAARSQYARHLAEGGPTRLAAVFREALARRARVMLEIFADAARAAGARAVVVIPPVNHDWARRNPPPWLGAGKTGRWFAHLRDAEAHLAGGNTDAALSSAAAMSALEDQVTGTPARIAARAHQKAGRLEAARDAAMDAVDAANWHNYSWALPQVPRFVGEIMRSEADRLGYTCVDLAERFTAHTGSPFHDFRLFFDQCHLTAEGTQVAMTAVAAAIEGPRLAERPDAPAPPSLIAAGGAFQGAHWLSQFYPAHDTAEVSARVAALLRQGLDADPNLAAVLLDQLRFKSLSSSPGLNGRYPKALRVPGVGAALGSARLNPPQIMAVLDVLRAIDAAAVEPVLDHVIESYHHRLRDGLDLAQPRFTERLWARTPLAWNDPHERHAAPLYRAPWPESRFALLTDGETPLRLDLVARSRIAATVQIVVNEAPQAVLQLDARWRRLAVEVAPAVLARGVNHIRLAWGGINMEDGAAVAEAERRLAMGIDADLFPIFGEVYGLTARID